VFASHQFGSVAFSLAAVMLWGTSDFLGGYATRRANAFVFTSIVNMGGLVLVGGLATASRIPLPSPYVVLWAVAGGVSGGASLAIFYRALSSSRMGLTAPIAAVLSAAIPAVVAMFTQGLPGKIAISGFALAVLGLWLITRTEDGTTPEGIELAIVGGIGFAGFYLCVHKAGEGSAFWIATLTRSGGLVVTALIVIAQRTFRDITTSGILWGVLTGSIDSLGTVLFVRACQSGRLDEAVVLSSLYPAITVLLARMFLKEHLTRWRFVGMLAALAAVPMIAAG
jgi:drug/metabolite transporter (DMT)-like permease